MFNHKFPSVPAISLDSLAEALRSPQEAVRLMDQWKVAKEAYEASKADYEAAKAEWESKQKVLDEKEVIVNKGWSELYEAQKLFKEQQVQDAKNWDLIKKKAADKEKALESQQGQLVQYDTALRAKEAALLAETNTATVKLAERLEKVEKAEAAISAREEAVVAREQKAEKLAAFLKGV